MKIADITFWTDYVNNWKAFKDKTKRSRQKPMKIWKEIPEIVLETLNEFRHEFKRFSLLSNKKLLRETHDTWRHLKKEMDKRNLQIFREKQIVQEDDTNIKINKNMSKRTINSLQLLKPSKGDNKRKIYHNI